MEGIAKYWTTLEQVRAKLRSLRQSAIRQHQTVERTGADGDRIRDTWDIVILSLNEATNSVERAIGALDILDVL